MAVNPTTGSDGVGNVLVIIIPNTDHNNNNNINNENGTVTEEWALDRHSRCKHVLILVKTVLATTCTCTQYTYKAITIYNLFTLSEYIFILTISHEILM